MTGTKDGHATVSRTSAATGAVTLKTLQAATPTISGAVAVGWTLTAKPGTWTGGTTLSYQWLADGTAIARATGSTFMPTAAQVGKRISVRVAGAKADHASITATSAATAKVLSAGKVTITGTASVGARLTAKPGTWTGGTKLSYQWLADGKAIARATGATFTLTKAQAGKRISVRVTGAKAGHATIAVTSAQTAKVLTAGKVTIAGTAKVKAKLTARPGTWTVGTTLTYQWYANGAAITGATKSTFTVAAAQAGKRITVRVTGSRSGFATVAATSGQTAAVKR